MSALDTALVDTLELQRGNDVKEFFALGGPVRFLREPALRMARHFDLTPAFLVLDPALGSLGIVEVALPSNPLKQKAAAVVHAILTRPPTRGTCYSATRNWTAARR